MPLNDRQTRALALAQAASAGISAGDLARACPEWSAETWRLELVELADRGLLIAKGERRGRRYHWPRGEARAPFHRILDIVVSLPPDRLGGVVDLLERGPAFPTVTVEDA